VENNLFLAPGEGDSAEPGAAGNGNAPAPRNGSGKSADALGVLKGEVR
jgi:hypothetical protein